MKESEPGLPTILKIYKQAIASVPILKFSKVLVATSCILALIAYLKLENATVFLYALGVIIISFLCFLFSLFLQNNDPVIKFLKYLLVTCITITTAVAILGFAFFIIWGKPEFYNRWFSDQNTPKLDSTKRLIVSKNNVEKETAKPTAQLTTKKVSKKPQIKILLSIQLKEQTDGYSKIFVDGQEIPVLAESTKFNPRIELSANLLNKTLLIITSKGDTCISLLPSHIDPSLFRFIPNCD
jgi:hypothetical protein